MSPWLKPRLVALCCGALLLGGAFVLHAQNDFPAPAKTPEEAAINFYRLLDLVRQLPRGGDESSTDTATLERLSGSVERTQFAAFRVGNSLEKTFGVLAQQSVAQPFEAQVQSSRGGQTIVSVAPVTQPKAREVVVVPEDGGYRVDIVATYGRWNGLTGLDADKALYRETGFLSPNLSTQSGYLGAATLSNCQSNQKQVMLGLLQYVQDYDEKYPPARKWVDVLQPYVKNEQIFRCPALVKDGNGYAYNTNLSQKPLAAVNQPAQTINIYETSNLARNLFAPFTGRAYRHEKGGEEGMNIGFADGHVKWFARGKATGLTITPEAQDAGFITISTGASQ